MNLARGGKMSELKITIQNIGAFDIQKTFTLKKGINIIKAPNALGKTSLIKALELAVLPEEELQDKGHYMHLFATDPLATATVSILSEDKTWGRKFRRSNGSLLAVGEPFYENGGKAFMVCFAVPENELINLMIRGGSIKSYIEDISDSHYYDLAVKFLKDEKERSLQKLQYYRDRLFLLDELKGRMESEQKGLEELRTKLDSLPPIDHEMLVRQKKITTEYEEKYRSLSEIKRRLGELRGQFEEINHTITDLEKRITSQDALIKEIEKQHPIIDAEIKETEAKINSMESQLNKLITEQGYVEDQLNIAREVVVKRQQYKDQICHACGRPLDPEHLAKRIDYLTSRYTELGVEIKKLQGSIETLKASKRALEERKQRLMSYKDILREYKSQLQEQERKKEQTEQKIFKLEKEKENLEQELKKLEQTIDKQIKELLDLRTTLEVDIETRRSRIKALQARIEELTEEIKPAEKLEKRVLFLEKALDYMEKRAKEVATAVINRFNERVNEIFDILRFKDFHKIEIDDVNFKVHVYRSRNGQIIKFPLEALSTSERITLAVAMLIAGKQEYFPDFPFFVLDELVTSYDPTRFQKLIQYLGNVTDYVIVTSLAPEEEQELRIEYAKPSI
jgi:DNA repair exonuclease SbcCD ATPase subunit